GEWDDRGISGVSRWLNRVWGLIEDGYIPRHPTPTAIQALRRATHRTIKKVTQDIERFHFNTVVAALMELTNLMGLVRGAGDADPAAYEEARDSLLLLLAPAAPHITEELWYRLGKPYSIHTHPFPVADEKLAREEEVTLVVQVNGRLRDRLTVPLGTGEAEARELALASGRVQAQLEGKHIAKTVFVPNRLVNLVVR
ncbi:MAG: class I tRNA ligase family protein, partial [Dehalococcoidia bacterium]|nr:class I tRNA ligase family protein [Dehalococcoidia bacterium]